MRDKSPFLVLLKLPNWKELPKLEDRVALAEKLRISVLSGFTSISPDKLMSCCQFLKLGLSLKDKDWGNTFAVWLSDSEVEKLKASSSISAVLKWHESFGSLPTR